ncbi:GTP cyclohydrolase I [Agromyces mariniharenae]|uniref:GTP cyclohydrolase 1 n=1 Tax=Agromyces mariniharenae TaxID=2604423 RepID=A0A5S4V5N5_9MICO|nr:GTP cyclohydrolase I [Agromyces mariniharenae]TYL54447.1 GTP cyclohydrolase I [Agromyces mariniharenae]
MSPEGTPAIVSLHAVTDDERARPAIDRDRARAAVADLLIALGQDLDSPHLAETPRRAADALIELLTPEPFRATTFPNDEGCDDLVVVAGIPFHSLCEHHLLPFRGVAHVGYLPGDRLVGLSKLARIVEQSSRSLQVQERMTRQLAEWLERELAPRGTGVVLEAEHLCMSLRGPRIVGSVTTTRSFTGLLRDDERLRREFESRCDAQGMERTR